MVLPPATPHESRRSGAERLIALDAIRGFAVIGIAFMNIAAFAMPFAAYDDPRVAGGRSPADLAAWTVDFVLVDGKMRALFSALFGASMLLVINRAAAARRNPAAVHLRRMAWLLVIGAVHAFLIWFGDILILYAICGTLMLAARNRAPHELVIGGLLLMLLPILWGVALCASGIGYDLDPRADRLDTLVHLSSYGAILRDRFATQPGLIRDQLLGAGPETLGLMALGMAGLKTGFLGGAWPRRRYARVALTCYAVGLPPLLLLAALLPASGFDGRLLLGADEVVGALCRPVIATGHAAALLWWLSRTISPLGHRLAAAGRMALSNYLLTSLIGTSLCYGYGLALFGHLNRAGQFGIACALGLLMLGWSAPWLKRFRYGPAEWVWRSLARWQLQPIRLAS